MEKNFISKNGAFSIQEKEILSEKEQAMVDSGFNSHALQAIGHDGSIVPFAFTASNEAEVVGVLNGRYFWGSLHIRHLFVSPSYRGRGVGKALIQAAIESGKKNACRFATVETMSFQALDFYRKLGFKIDFSREGYDRNCIFHYLSQVL